jgi:hypothetical protein
MPRAAADAAAGVQVLGFDGREVHGRWLPFCGPFYR